MSSEVLLRRPDILQAEHVLKGANANIGATRAAFLPPHFSDHRPGNRQRRPGGPLSTRLRRLELRPSNRAADFDARTWSGLKAIKVDREIAVAQYEKAIQAAFKEVADALARKGTVGDQLAAQQSLVDASAKAYQLSNSRYEKGIDIYLNVLDAQRSL